MAILETLYLLFKADTTDLKTGKKEAAKEVDEIVDRFKKLDSESQKVGKSLAETLKTVAKFVGAVSAGYTVLRGITAANDYALELGNASRALGVNAQDLDAWGNVVKRTGGTSESFQNSLKALAQHFNSIPAVALQSLSKLAETFQKLGQFRALQYGKSLGLDEPTILLLQQGGREVERLIARQKELGTVSEKDIEIARKYKIANIELETAFRSLNLQLSQVFIPLLTDAYNAFTPFVEYLTAHKDLVIGALIGIGVAAGLAATPFVATNAAVIGLTTSIGLLIAAFAVLFEDFKYFNENKPSFIGKYIAPYIKAAPRTHPLFSYNYDSDLIAKAQDQLTTADNSPLNSQTSNSMFNSQSFARNAQINVGDVTINTQATDAVGIAKTFRKLVSDQHWQANNYFANGEAS